LPDFFPVFSQRDFLIPTHWPPPHTCLLPHQRASSLTESQPPGFRGACHLPSYRYQTFGCSYQAYRRHSCLSLPHHRSGLSAIPVPDPNLPRTAAHATLILFLLALRLPNSAGEGEHHNRASVSTLKFNLCSFSHQFRVNHHSYTRPPNLRPSSNPSLSP